jgi:hypothetical protein
MHVVLDGVFVRDADHGVVFHAAPPPTLVDLEAIVRPVRACALVKSSSLSSTAAALRTSSSSGATPRKASESMPRA